MPQMAPMSWLWLFISFFFIFILFNYLNYFTFMKTEKTSNNLKMTKNMFNWKW